MRRCPATQTTGSTCRGWGAGAIAAPAPPKDANSPREIGKKSTMRNVRRIGMEGQHMTRFRLIVAAMALAGVLSDAARAADHADGPRASADPSADITDVFAWMSPDAQRVILVMSVVRNASAQSRFSNSVDYVFHTTSSARFGGAPSAERDIVCTFNKKQRVRCRGPQGLRVIGDASRPTGI